MTRAIEDRPGPAGQLQGGHHHEGRQQAEKRQRPQEQACHDRVEEIGRRLPFAEALFAQMGIDVEKEMRIVDAKRQETVILGVYKGEADAGFVRESALEVVREEIDMTKIRVLAYTKPLPNWPFAAAGNAPPALVRDVKRHLIELKDREILAAAKIRAFRAADEREFEALKGY
ncbi:MAG: phosphate/phosphite/phosphonate ABC transporter substrate-binding protein [Desulfobacterales bacterium]|nr:phosphate/phosphite/phosphonate ABC transporter substrate-binding protein [Desulfobacterales bacterium]